MKNGFDEAPCGEKLEAKRGSQMKFFGFCFQKLKKFSLSKKSWVLASASSTSPFLINKITNSFFSQENTNLL